jgi:5-methylcytosine-specific restriction protein B
MSSGPIMRVLYGPPGTGKTWLAAREAVWAVEPESHAAWLANSLSDKDLLKKHEKLVRAGQIKWVTFHPSYAYEDFVEGFRPEQKDDGSAIRFRVQKGPFRAICDAASGLATQFGPPAGAIIPSISDRKEYEVLEVVDQGWLLRVRPDRADEVGDEQQKFVLRSLVMKALELNFDPKVFSIPGKAMVKPSDYGVTGPVQVVGNDLRRVVGESLGVSSSDLANSAHVGAVAQYILRQRQEIPKPVRCCLVIDEINRADLSRVFGELITLLEPDKRIGAPEERRVHLPYSGDRFFGVPSTLSVVGTMNTADRSISAMDFAMRRRFSFKEVSPDPGHCPTAYGGIDLSGVLTGINRRVEVLRGRNYRLGHSAFMEIALENARMDMKWSDDDKGRLMAIAHALRSRVLPLLEEYFHEDYRKIEVALGTRGKLFGPSKVGLFNSQPLSTSELETFGEVFDTDGLTLGQPSGWWNPESTAFDTAAFAEAVRAMA